MNLALIETFSAVMKTGSTTRAAALLRISQPAVSRSIRRLEDTTKLKLFERSGPRLIPTPEAALLYQEILATHVGLERLRQSVTRLREVGAGSLKIACSAAVGLTFLPAVIQEFLKSRRDVQITFEIASSSTVRTMVLNGLFDFGLCADEIDTTHLEVAPFIESPGVCVMPADHPLAKRAEIGPLDLDGLPFIGLAPEDRARIMLQAILDAVGAKPKLVVETSFAATVCQLALEGVGVGIANSLSYHSGRFKALGLIAKPFNPSVSFRSLIIYPPDRARSQILDEFLTVLARHRLRILAEIG
ncbi:MAG: LysR substrate-binding domain-containing protein [Elsteraceae bacterium]